MNTLEPSNPNVACTALGYLCLIALAAVSVFLSVVCLQVAYSGKKLALVWKRHFLVCSGILMTFYIYGMYLFISWCAKGMPKLGITPNADMVDRILFWSPILLALTSLLVTCRAAYLASCWLVKKYGAKCLVFVNNLLKPVKRYFTMVANLRKEARQNLMNAFRNRKV